MVYHSYPWNRRTHQNHEPSAPERVQTPHLQWALWTALTQPAGPHSQFLGIYRVQQEAPAFYSTLCYFLLAPNISLRSCGAGSHRLHFLPLPFPKVPSPFWVWHLCNVKKHNLPSTRVVLHRIFTTCLSDCDNHDSSLWYNSYDYRTVFMLCPLPKQWRAIVLTCLCSRL